MKKYIIFILICVISSFCYCITASTANMKINNDQLYSRFSPFWPSSDKKGKWILDINSCEKRFIYSPSVTVNIKALYDDVRINGESKYSVILSPGDTTDLKIVYEKDYSIGARLIEVTFFTGKNIVNTYCLIKEYNEGGHPAKYLSHESNYNESYIFNIYASTIENSSTTFPADITYTISPNEDTSLRSPINDTDFFIHLYSPLKGNTIFTSGKINGKNAFSFENSETGLKSDSFIFDNQDLYILANSQYPHDKSDNNKFSVLARNSSSYFGSIGLKLNPIHNLEVINKNKALPVPYVISGSTNQNKYLWYIIFIKTNIEVTNTNDSGADSLREAINKAMNGDIITFKLPSKSKIKIKDPISINKYITIDGSIDGGRVELDYDNDSFSLLNIDPNCEVILNNLAIKGEICNNGDVWLNSCDLLDAAFDIGFHYIIKNKGNLSITNTKSCNSEHQYQIFNDEKTWIYNSDIYGKISNNLGAMYILSSNIGHIDNMLGRLEIRNSNCYNYCDLGMGCIYIGRSSRVTTISNSTIENKIEDCTSEAINNQRTAFICKCNISKFHIKQYTNHFGAAGITNRGTMRIDKAFIYDNTNIEIINHKSSDFSAKGGGIYNGGDMSLMNSIISDNHIVRVLAGAINAGGGGIFNDKGAFLSLYKCEINRNSIPDDIWGGGINNNFGTVMIHDSSIIGNTGAKLGGGIVNTYKVTLSKVKMLDNKGTNGGGIYNWVSNMGKPILTFTGTTTITGNEASVNGGGIYNGKGAMIEGRQYLDCHNNRPNDIYEERNNSN